MRLESRIESKLDKGKVADLSLVTLLTITGCIILVSVWFCCRRLLSNSRVTLFKSNFMDFAI